jgi:hypothetical protein
MSVLRLVAPQSEPLALQTRSRINPTLRKS